MKIINRKRLTWLVILTVSIMAAWIMFTKERFVMNELSPTVPFVQNHMTNSNGTLATYLQDASSEDPNIVAGREALSESLGLWMQYAVAKNDQVLFEQSYDLLTTYFLMPQNYIAWKLDADGTSHVNTNALGDDFRIVDALLKAADQWEQGREEKLATASDIIRTLTKSVQNKGYYVDFHDFKGGYSPDTLSLVYVDMPALKQMEEHEMVQPGTYAKYEYLLRSMPDDGIFYPKTFNVVTKAYTYDDKVNLIDQLIVANHLTSTNRKPDKLIAFLKKEFETRHQLPGQYERMNRTPGVTYESPSVYGLAILLAVRTGDPKWAKQLYNHMITMRGQDTNYPGGYVFAGNTHMFDNLFSLLGETELQKFLKK
ncbi:MAG TPA: glycosyl hydrolase [Paenibacillus sp.]|uniref:glycosyl hydrolase family 8 n=1 Tax=Paenibacillus TaxID=44249 RepID=UPI000BA0A22B|nr:MULTISPECIES: glycosyl hydrolase family 8 [Paenibacillus]OZQ71301.1 glycosyl hydrolase [Paenibacillus taichungensis]HBU83790.1 glycosyl hydrolase [Paenibacillus sp.]